MLEQLHYRGRAVHGFGLASNGGTMVDSTSVLSALGADPSTVYNAYQAQQGFAQMGKVFGQAEQTAAARDDCVKGCGANLNCSNQCSKAAVLAWESIGTSIATAFNPIAGLLIGGLFSVLNQVFGFAQGVGDPACPNGPNPWPPSPQDMQTLQAATQTIFAGATAPGGLAPQGVTDPFLMAVAFFRAQQSALIENCHWDQALSGNGVIAAEAVMLKHWNDLHVGASETITRTVFSLGFNQPNPPDFDQWTFFVSELYFAVTPHPQPGDQASITINRGTLNPNLVIQQGPGQAAAPTSTGKKLVTGVAVATGLGAGAIWAYAISQGISFAQAWRKLTHAVGRGGA